MTNTPEDQLVEILSNCGRRKTRKLKQSLIDTDRTWTQRNNQSIGRVKKRCHRNYSKFTKRSEG